MAYNNPIRKRRKNKLFNLLFLLSVVLMSCDNNSIKTYTSVTGSWRCVEFSTQFGQRSYLLDIYKSKSGTSNFLISNFHNDGYENIFVTFALNSNKITLTNQNLNQGLIVKSGNGIVSQDFKEIELNYIIFDGKTDIPVNVVYTR